MGLYGSPYDYVIHVAIIATLRVALITSFQPPLNLLLVSQALHDIYGTCSAINCHGIIEERLLHLTEIVEETDIQKIKINNTLLMLLTYTPSNIWYTKHSYQTMVTSLLFTAWINIWW